MSYEPFFVAVAGEIVSPAPPKRVDGRDLPADLPKPHRDVLGFLHGCAFWAPVCCPSQELIARATGLSRVKVNRICHELRDRGLIKWEWRRRAGSRWRHNVYTLLMHWARPFRKAVVARLRRIPSRLLNTKRTTTAFEERERPGSSALRVEEVAPSRASETSFDRGRWRSSPPGPSDVETEFWPRSGYARECWS